MTNPPSPAVAVIGAGPAGLTAAYELAKGGRSAEVFEKDLVPGGISRTVERKGYYFDIGGHRFFTHFKEVEDLWMEALDPSEWLENQRLSRIYFERKMFNYPLSAGNVLGQMGVRRSLLILLSYLKVKIFPLEEERTFEQWVTNRFGEQLYRTFFKEYTEKVLGVPCSEILAEWASQRIRGLSLLTAMRSALMKGENGGGKAGIRTLTDTFHYPKFGPGMLWESMAGKIVSHGGRVHYGSPVGKILLENGLVTSLEIREDGRARRIDADHVISSMPLSDLVLSLEPAPPREVLDAARALRYRDFITVALMVDREEVFPDHWVYVHEPHVRVGRIQNFKNWSPYMVPSPEKSCLGMEYFCSRGDDLWSLDDGQLVEKAAKEAWMLNVARPEDVRDGEVVRVPKAYPMYDFSYVRSLDRLREYIGTIGNIQVVGRNGMHRYNNQDHSMMTALLAARNLLGENHDIWSLDMA